MIYKDNTNNYLLISYMSKKEISWIELINVMIAERKKQGKAAGVKDVMDDAKKEWSLIKSGKHDKYVKGKPKISRKKGKKSKKNKTSKLGKNKNCNEEGTVSAKVIFQKCDLCKNCKKEVNNLFKI